MLRLEPMTWHPLRPSLTLNCRSIVVDLGMCFRLTPPIPVAHATAKGKFDVLSKVSPLDLQTARHYRSSSVGWRRTLRGRGLPITSQST